MTRAGQVLAIIEAAGSLTFREIQQVAWRLSHGAEPFTRAQRGWWCTTLMGSWYRTGLLRVYCTKGADGRWRRNDVPYTGLKNARESKPRFGWS